MKASRLPLSFEKRPRVLAQYIPQIVAISKQNKEALGFLPDGAYHDAIFQHRLIGAFLNADSNAPTVVGYILFGGVFPHGSIYQLGVHNSFQRRGIASALIEELISDLEKIGFMTVKAKVAMDLEVAQACYQRNGFEILRQIPGGQARKRTIVVRIRELQTDHLFSKVPDIETVEGFELGIQRRSPGDSPFYTFDLNVFFDLVRNRSRHNFAAQLFSAALGHQIKLVVAPEFIVELERNSAGRTDDPILQMAKRLPRLPSASTHEIETLADRIHELVFVRPNARGKDTLQAKSDSKHIAHSALARATAFITSDTTILASRDELLSKVGLDVASLEELTDLLQTKTEIPGQQLLQGTTFECRSPTDTEFKEYLRASKMPESIIAEHESDIPNGSRRRREAIFEANKIVGIISVIVPIGIDRAAKLLMHVEQEHISCDFFTDYLLDTSIRFACADSVITIRLDTARGQSSTHTLAKARGFSRTEPEGYFEKIAIGRPVTKQQWTKVVTEVRRRTGLCLPSNASAMASSTRSLTFANRAGRKVTVKLASLEDILSPTLIAWPGRDGVIVPIARSYAVELFGATDQMTLPFIKSRDAAFLSQRAYINSSKTAHLMRPGMPILFYESVRSGGRGAVIAAARIVDAIVTRKGEIPSEDERRIVVDNIDNLLSSDEVLLTTFDNILPLPSPVPLSVLREINALGKANLITAQPLSAERIEKILDSGWSNA